MFQPHQFQVDLQLFGDQHRDGGIGALTHLDIGHGQDDLPVAVDADEGVRHEVIRVSRFGFAAGERNTQAQKQAAAGGRSNVQEFAPRQSVCPCRPIRGNEVIEDHRQSPCAIDFAACLIASRMRT
jgi:hypothetical protein